MPEPRLLLVMGESTGGTGRHVGMLAAAMTERDLAVTICTPAGTAARLTLAATGARVVELPVGSGRGAIRAVRGVRRLAGGSDVVHAHGLRAALVTALARPAVSVATWHNAPLAGGVRGFVHSGLERIAARGCDLTLAASPDLAVRARRAGGRDVRNVFVPAPTPARSGVAGAALRRSLGADDRPLLLAVGRLHRQKRLDVLIAAAARWRDRSPRPLLVIAGDGPLRLALERQATAAGADVQFLGARDDVPDLLAAADVAVISSDWEARPLVAQEALRAGVPLVASRVGGLPELVGEAALLVPPGRPADVATAVQRVLDDSALRRRLAAAGPVQAATWPPAAACWDQHHAIYLDLTSRSSIC